MAAFRRIGLSLLLLAVLIAGLIWSLPTIARLGLAGLGKVTFTTLDIGLRQATVRDLAIGEPPGQRVALIRIEYSLRGLLRGALDRIVIEGLHVRTELEDGGGPRPGDRSGGPEDGAASLPSMMPVPQELIVRDGRIDVKTPVGWVAVPFAGRIETRGDRLQFAFETEDATLKAGRGSVHAGLEISGAAPRSPSWALDQVTASGRLRLRADDAGIPGLQESLNGEGEIALQVAGGRMSASSEPLAFAIDGRVTGAAGAMTAELLAEIALDDGGGLRRVERGELTLALADVAVAGATLKQGRIGLEIAGEGRTLGGSLSLQLEGFGWSAADLEVVGVSMDQRFGLALRDQVLSLTPGPAARKMSIAGLTVADVLQSGWFTVQWPASEQPWLRLDLASGRFEQRLEAAIDPVRLDRGSARFWARIEDLSVRTDGDGSGLQAGEVRVREGRADLPGANLALVGIDSVVALDGGGLAPSQSIPLWIRAVRPLDEPRWFAPVRLDAELRPEPDRLSFAGRATSGGVHAVRLDIAGRHDRRSGDGSLDFKLRPLDFTPGGLQPSDLAPRLAGLVEEAAGRLALDGGLRWRDGAIDGQMALLIEELGLVIGPARLERINSVIRFDHLAPLTTPPDQPLSVGLLDVGLPLTDGLVSMQLRPDGRLAVDRLEWRFADGRIRAEPFTLSSDVEDLTMKLKAERLDLNRLLGMSRLDGLSGEGKIEGLLPLTISGAAAEIEKGELFATAPGVLRYKPGNAPSVLAAGGASIGLMLQALENFHYDALKVTMDGRTDDAMDIGLHLKGANPDLYDGHPVEFNLNLDGNLAGLISANLDNYQIPDRIRERLQRFGR